MDPRFDEDVFLSIFELFSSHVFQPRLYVAFFERAGLCRYAVVIGGIRCGIRWYPVVSGGIRWYPVVSGGIRVVSGRYPGGIRVVSGGIRWWYPGGIRWYPVVSAGIRLRPLEAYTRDGSCMRRMRFLFCSHICVSSKTVHGLDTRIQESFILKHAARTYKTMKTANCCILMDQSSKKMRGAPKKVSKVKMKLAKLLTFLTALTSGDKKMPLTLLQLGSNFRKLHN